MSRLLVERDSTNTRHQRSLAGGYSGLGDVGLETGQLAETVKHFSAALEIYERLRKQDAGDAQALRDVSSSYYQNGNAHLRIGAVQQALDFFRKALDVNEHLVEIDPTNSDPATLSLEDRDPSTRPFCPAISDCFAFAWHCLTPGPRAMINGGDSCTLALESCSWSSVKELYR